MEGMGPLEASVHVNSTNPLRTYSGFDASPAAEYDDPRGISPVTPLDSQQLFFEGEVRVEAESGTPGPKESVPDPVGELLAASVSSFLDEGALVKPNPHATMRDNLASICDAKNFSYGIFWELDREKQTLSAKDMYSVAGEERSATQFCTTSCTLTTFPVGLGAVGAVAAKGVPDWRSSVQTDLGRFQRRELAVSNGIQTVVLIPVGGGVVELGSPAVLPESAGTIKYVGLLMCANGH